MGAPAWSEEDKELLRKFWPTKGSLKAIAAKHFPDRTAEGLKTQGHRLGLPKRGSLKYDQPAYMGIAVRKALESNESLTCYEIEILTGVKLGTAQSYVKKWHRADELHIVDWRRRSPDGQCSSAYKIGKGQDVSRPVAKTPARVQREMYAREVGIKKRANPFSVAAGQVQVPIGQTGRIYRQSMEIDEWSQSRAA